MVYILGVGNVLLKDDGVGVRIIEELQTRDMPPEVQILDVGTGILRMLPKLVKATKIIIVDAIKGGGAPGTIYKLEDIEARLEKTRSVHDIQFEDILNDLKLLGVSPEVQYYGIEPQEICFSMELSPVIAQKVPILADYIISQL